MIELPEAAGLADQITRTVAGRTISGATSSGGHLVIAADELRIVLSEGAFPRLYAAGAPMPAKHQLRINLDDGGTLAVAVTMYGGIQVFHDGENDNPYYRVATTKPSPLTPACLLYTSPSPRDG